MLVACGSVLENLDAVAPSKSERDWLEGKSETPELETTGITDKHACMLNGTKWEIFIVRREGRLAEGHFR
jgi:hypothetical protein